jgi:hypothetical protein
MELFILKSIHMKARRVFLTQAPRIISGFKKQEATGAWRKLNNRKLPNLYYYCYNIEELAICSVLIGNPEGQLLLKTRA